MGRPGGSGSFSSQTPGGISSNTAKLGYTHPWRDKWIFEAGYCWYDQSAADFYSDLFARADAQNFLARDKERSTFTSHMLSVGATYQLPPLGWKLVQKSTVNLLIDHIFYDHQDFREVTGGASGTEPAYSYHATVIRLLFSDWF